MTTEPTGGAPAATPSVPEVPIAKMLHGVDVSSAQGAPATWHSSAGSITWAGVKITELQPGGVYYVNPDASADWAYLKQHKLARIAYMFAHPSVGPQDSVDFFVAQVRALGLVDADGVMLDLEQTDGLGPAAVSAWAVRVMANLKETLNRTPILYTYLDFAYSGNTAGLGKYPLWISDPSSPAGKPQVPSPWTSWAIHQYVTTGEIDRDLANFASVKAMQDAFGVASPPPGPKTGNLGGSIASGVTAVRWSDGSMVVAGIDGLGHVAVRRFDGGTGKWGVWWNPAGTTKAAGQPGLVSWGDANGQLFFATEAGAVMELATENSGKSWQ